MSKHVEFGKDLSLMTQVARVGSSVDIDAQFWDALSKRQPGLWNVIREFFNTPTSEYWKLLPLWRKEPAFRLRREPGFETIEQAVRNGREFGFGKPDWQLLAENPKLFKALVDYLNLAPPFTVEVEVDYDSKPKFIGSYGPPFFYSSGRSGLACRQMSIYTHSGGDTSVESLDAYLAPKGWAFAEQHELYAFGKGTREHIRPWVLHGTRPILGLGSTNGSADPLVTRCPKLWIANDIYELDVGSYARRIGVVESGITDGNSLLIVKN